MKQKNSFKFPIVLVNAQNNDLLLNQGFLEKCQEFGWRIVDINMTMGLIPEGHEIIGGIINVPADHPKAQKIVNTGLPIVRVGRLENPLDKEIPAVITDNKSMAILAAEHFIQRNFKNVGYIGHVSWSMSKELYETFKQYAEHHGVKCHLLRYSHIAEEPNKQRYERRISELKTWLAGLPKPVGILTNNDFVGSFITTMCQSAKLTIPEQVAILGCGNNELICERTLVPISSIEMGRKAQGAMAMTLLNRLVNGETITESPVIIPPVGVIERESTNILAVPNALVAKVLKFIWNNLELQLSIDDIAKTHGVSRSKLDHCFRRCLGRSPSAERHRKRLERCAELLRNSNLNIAEIADIAGFPNVSYLHRSFRKKFGMTLKKYRIGKPQ